MTNKEYRLYKKMLRRQKKEIIKAAKKFKTFDWGYMHEMIVLMVKQFLEYYKLGINVFQEDQSKNEIIKELETALKYQYTYEHAYDRYNDKIKEKYNNFENFEDFIKSINNRSETEEEIANNREEMQKSDAIETKSFESFYRYLGKHMREWWD